MEFPNCIIVTRSWYDNNDNYIKNFKETYDFDYSIAFVDDWACDYTKYVKDSDKFYCDIYEPRGLYLCFFEKFVKDLLSLNGKKRKRKNGYTTYKVEVE